MKTLKWGGKRDGGKVKVGDVVCNLFDGLVIAEQKKKELHNVF